MAHGKKSREQKSPYQHSHDLKEKVTKLVTWPCAGATFTRCNDVIDEIIISELAYYIIPVLFHRINDLFHAHSHVIRHV